MKNISKKFTFLINISVRDKTKIFLKKTFFDFVSIFVKQKFLLAPKSNISQKLKKWLITEGRPKPVGQKYKLRFLLKIAIFVKN